MTKFFRATLWTLAGCVLLAAIFHTAILSALGSYLVSAGAPQKSDIALVLAGDASGNRIVTAASLVRDGYAPVALISGPAGMYGHHESDLAIPFAEKAGFPESYFIAVPNEGRSTKEEARAILPEIRQRGAKTVLLVTSNYHTRRAGRIYRELAPDLRFNVVAAPDENFSVDGWWKNREGRKTFAIEWMKTVAEWIGL